MKNWELPKSGMKGTCTMDEKLDEKLDENG
jgi:hypothetical protein